MESINFTPLVAPHVIASQVILTANQIFDHYSGVIGDIVAIPILVGAMPFATDLLRHLRLRVRVEPIRASSYKGEQSTGKVDFTLDPETVRGRHVLIIEDILDTGVTLGAVLSAVRQAEPLSVEIAVLLRKKGTQRAFVEDPKWVCFTVPDVFVVGYGLDLDGLHRNLPFIGMVEKEGEPLKIVAGV